MGIVRVQDEQQYEQLMLQYTQLKNGSDEIFRMIENEDFDEAITMIKSREALFLNCKCMRKYLELTPEQQKELDSILDELKELELRNIKKLEKGMEEVQAELKKSQQSQKFQHAYDVDTDSKGSIINIQE